MLIQNSGTQSPLCYQTQYSSYNRIKIKKTMSNKPTSPHLEEHKNLNKDKQRYFINKKNIFSEIPIEFKGANIL